VLKALKNRTSAHKTVAIVGVGGLGCPVAWTLAHEGISLRLLDEDKVERTNLHRQILFTDKDVGMHKVIAAQRALASLCSAISIEAIQEHVTPERCLDLLEDCALVVEGSDNLATKFLVADACKILGVPVVHGACVGWIGTVLPVVWSHAACYRCVFEDLPEPEMDAANCSTAGVYGPVTSIVGALMAADALQILNGNFARAGSLARYDGWRQTFRATTIARRSDCSLCGDKSQRPTLHPQRYVSNVCE
jgi:molybdopterin/thiamine biosynthesis adenylyltransferase